MAYQPCPLLKYYSKNRRHAPKTICGNLDIARIYHINLQTLTSKSMREKSDGLTQKCFHNDRKIYFKPVRPKFSKEIQL